MEAVSNSSVDVNARLADPELRRMVEAFVRRRVPDVEVDDVVQTVLCDALASEGVPDDDEQLRKWLVGITRHKVADFHRKGSRAKLVELPEQLPAEKEAHSAREWASWAEKQTEGDPEAKLTLDWMARESTGEKLAHIAEDAELPAPQVRQRVSRMRRWMREQWKAELAAVAIVSAVAALVAWMMLRGDTPVADPVQPEPVPELAPTSNPRLERAAKLRADALSECEREAWTECLKGLDDAARIDAAGDATDEVRAARRRATEALELQKAPEQTDSKLDQPAPTAVPLRATPSSQAPTNVAPKKVPTTKGKPSPVKGGKSLITSEGDDFGTKPAPPPPVAPQPAPSDLGQQQIKK